MQDLSQIPLLAPLSKEQVQRFGQRCSWRDYGEHELVIDIDDESTDVRFVLSGAVRIIIRIAVGKEVILGELEAGSFFGEISAIDGSPRSANVTTLHRSRICTMPADIFKNILEECPPIAMAILKSMAYRIRTLNIKLAEHSFLQSRHRLYCELLRLSKPRTAQRDHRIISPPPTQRELAERIGTRREVVSRELNQLQRQGHIDKTRGGIIIMNVDELQNRILKGWKGSK